ncbi:2-oxoacid:acceptor oxidoreductase subunit alpha [Thermovibrio ammonificans]|uniref:Pyruvate flavodoxin/ferredoxin oxidoreductase domain protein n=1 Tax=Thermovibrio ammonificans (strain DSM 15698 / JCM 12110 / HB-1) TaxID=648996 RepID=E8T445_THEA1|nr:2-oxoacid:acceptor oxidoreductase subunit alpha [Thermovibrio ammonificans]ADU97374.1 pyruvate flavodoxin/ferredoxin oxidoreductase domain protein [Thermovibrio ammonificans HB-1]
MARLELKYGNHACAEAAILAGCRFYAGYPITPSSEIAEKMAELLPKVGGAFIQMEDEIAAMGATVGASMAGAKAMTATSGPGFSLKQENLGYAFMVEAPCVVVNVQRGGPSTGLPTQPGQQEIMQSLWGTHGDKLIPVFYPGNVQEIMEETIRAFNWAERLRTPVVLLLDEVLGHMRETVDMEQFTPDKVEIWNRKQPTVPPEEYLPYKPGEDLVPAIADYGTPGYRGHATGLHHDYTGFPTTDPQMCQELIERLINKVKRVQPELEKNEFYKLDDAEFAIVTFGTTARAAKTAVDMARDKGIKVGLLRVVTIWPSPEETLNKLAKSVKAILVPELNMGQYVLEVERCAKGECPVYRLNRANGKIIYPGEILAKIEEIAKGGK